MPLGEFDLIRRFFDRPARRALLGVGDDCALIDPFQVFAEQNSDASASTLAANVGVRQALNPSRNGAAPALAVTTDMLVCGRHFFEDASPESLGHKALAVNLSDLAAMGAEPVAFTLALALPGVDEVWLEAFARGLHRLADASGCELIGGDTTRGPLTISITAFGRVARDLALRRDAGSEGDDIWVSGALGGAAFAVSEGLAGRALAPEHSARIRMEWPQPRLALGTALLGVARAAIDVSDGLVADLGHICERSRLGAMVDWSAVPVDPSLVAVAEHDRQAFALTGGDDYELVFTAPTLSRDAVLSKAKACGVTVCRIGMLTRGAGVTVRGSEGVLMAPGRGGFDHFA